MSNAFYVSNLEYTFISALKGIFLKIPRVGLTFSVTVKTRTVKTIVPYDQFPKTWIQIGRIKSIEETMLNNLILRLFRR